MSDEYINLEKLRQHSLKSKDYVAGSFENKFLRMVEDGYKLGQISKALKVSSHALSKRILRRFGRCYTNIIRELRGEPRKRMESEEPAAEDLNVGIVHDVHDEDSFSRLIEKTKALDPEHAAWMKMVANQVKSKKVPMRC